MRVVRLLRGIGEDESHVGADNVLHVFGHAVVVRLADLVHRGHDQIDLLGELVGICATPARWKIRICRRSADIPGLLSRWESSSSDCGGWKVNVAFVEGVFATWLRMTDFLSLAICRITASPWWRPFSVWASSRPGPVTAIPWTNSGCASLKVSVAVILLDGSGDRRRGRGGAWRLVLPVRQVVLRPGIPEFDHGLGGVVIDGPGEREGAGRARRDQRFAQLHRPRRVIDDLEDVVPS